MVQIRNSVYMEYFGHNIPQSWNMNVDYRSIVKGDYKYIKFLRYDDVSELYNIKEDPYEMVNLINEPKMAEVIKELRQDLNQRVLHANGLIDIPNAL